MSKDFENYNSSFSFILSLKFLNNENEWGSNNSHKDFCNCK